MGYFIRLPFTVISEVIATSSSERRRRLLAVCRKLFAAGDCIEPHHEILKIMVRRFEASEPLDATNVNSE